MASGILPDVEPGFQPGGNSLETWNAGKSGVDPGGKMPSSTADRDVCRHGARGFQQKKRGCPWASPRQQLEWSGAYGETSRKKPAGFTPGVLV
jgi:hypothetical protein